MKIKIILTFLFLFSICSSNISAQDDQILSSVGKESITADAFRDRFEFMPHMNYTGSPDSLKNFFLYSLIAEKLWYLEALNSRIDTIDNVKYSLSTLHKLLTKDQFYRDEVLKKINIDPAEVEKVKNNFSRVLNVNMIVSPDSQTIFTAFTRIKNGAPFDSSLLDGGNKILKMNVNINFGKIEDEKAEKLLFLLKPGEFAAPILSSSKWYLFKLNYESVLKDSLITEEHKTNRAFTFVKERKEKNIAGELLDEIVGGMSVKGDKSLFFTLCDSLYSIIHQRQHLNQTSSKINLTETDLMKLLKRLTPADLSAPFIKFDTPSTLKDFIYYLVYQKLDFAAPEKDKFISLMSAALKQFAEDEMIYRHAASKGFDKHPEVLKDIQTWREFYLSEVMLESEGKKISADENELEQYVNAAGGMTENSAMINIIEILTQNLGEIERILDEINKGTDFKELAVLYNTRGITKESGGEWGYFPASAGGEIGKIASGMEIGEVFGPVKVPEGYSVFKLIGRKNNPATPSEKPDIKFLRTQLLLKKMNDLFNSKTADLAKKYGVTVDHQLLEGIEVSDVNTFTYRLIGFGGKIAALPITIPVYEWYRKYSEQPEVP